MQRRTGRYALSFSSGALLTREARLAAFLYLSSRDWATVRTKLIEGNLLQARTASSSVRLAREVVQRLTVLSDDELRLLVESAVGDRALLLWIAACRRYEFIGDFAMEVVRERFLLLTPDLGYAHFDGFVRQKALWHPELAELADSTRTKLRATVFRMLTEAGLLAEGRIVPALPSARLGEVLDARAPSDLRFLPVRAPQREQKEAAR
jgi:hypothetical protein